MRKREGLEPANEEQSVFQKLVTSRYYDPFMMCIVVTNCVFLAIADPKLDDTEQPKYIQMLSWAFNIAYVLDVTLQLQAFGLVRYLMDPWHYLDGIVSGVSAIEIILPIVSLVMAFFGQGGLQLSPSAKSGLNTIRIIRALRPLKAISFVPSLVAYVEAIFASAETVVMTMGILLIFLTGFGIFTNTTVGNALSYRCYPTNFTEPSVANSAYYIDFNTSYYSSKFNNAFCGRQSTSVKCPPGFTCKFLDLHWETVPADFSSPWRGVISCMSFLTLRGWPQVFWAIADTEGVGMAFLITAGVFILGAFTVVNLLPAIFIASLKLKEEYLSKILWLQYYPGSIDKVSELGLIIWAGANQELLLGKELDEANDSVVTLFLRFIWSKVHPASYDRNMMAIKKKAIENAANNVDVTDEVNKRPYRFCVPPCRSFVIMRDFIIPDNSPFNQFIIVVILLNILVMSIERVGEPDELATTVFACNVIFNAMFALEIVIKVFLLGPCIFLDSAFNLLDLFLVIMGLLTYGAGAPSFITNLRIIRLLRLARLYRLVKQVDIKGGLKSKNPTITLGRLLGMINDLINPIINAFALTVILLYILSLVGMQFFIFDRHDQYKELIPTANFIGNTTLFDMELAFGGKYRDRMNFNCFGNAFVTVFNVMVLNGWYESMIFSIVQSNNTMVMWYYFFIIFSCNYFTLATLMASVTSVMDNHAKKMLVDIAASNKVLLFNLSKYRDKSLLKTYFALFKRNTVETEDAIKLAELMGGTKKVARAAVGEAHQTDVQESFFTIFFRERATWSFYLLAPMSKQDRNIAWRLDKLLHSRFWGFVLWVAVGLASLGILTSNQVEGIEPYMWDIIGYYLVAIFLFEMIIKWMAYGFYFYFYQVLDVIDFTVNCAMILSTFFGFDILDTVRIVRCIKIPEMIRQFSKSLSLQLLIEAIQTSPPSILNVSFVIALLMYFFGVIGLQSFMGSSGYCSYSGYPGGASTFASIPPYYPNGCNGMAYVRDSFGFYSWKPIFWKNYEDNFDDIFSACKSTFRVVLMNEWEAILYHTMDATGNPFEQPSNNVNRVAFLYFLILAILSLTFTVLFLSTIYYHFFISSLIHGRATSYGDSVAQWTIFEERLRVIAPLQLGSRPPDSSFLGILHGRVLLWHLQRQPVYVAVMTFFSLVPLILLMGYYDDTYAHSEFVFIDTIFTFFYLFEWLTRILVTGPKFYKTIVGKQELVVVAVEVISLFWLIPSIMTGEVGDIHHIFLKVNVLVRLYRLVFVFEGMNILIKTMQMALSGIVPTILYLAMVVVIFGVLGKVSIGDFQPRYGDDYLNTRYNFDTYTHAIVTLAAMGTGNMWTEIILQIEKGKNFIFIVYVELYFLFFFLFASILIKSFALMMISKYLSHTGNSLGLAGQQIRQFKSAWYNLGNPGHMKIDKLMEFLQLVPAPLGHKGGEKKYIVVERFTKKVLLAMPSHSEHYDDSAPPESKKSRRLFKQVPDELADLRLDPENKYNFTFRQVLIAVHKAAMNPTKLPDDDTFLKERQTHQDRLGLLRLRLGRLAVSKAATDNSNPNAMAYRGLQLVQRIDRELYRRKFLSLMEDVFKVLKMRILSYGFKPFDGFVLTNLRKAMICENKSAGYIEEVCRLLNPKGGGTDKTESNMVAAIQHAVIIRRLYNQVNELYARFVGQLWNITSLQKVCEVKEKKAITAIATDMNSNIYVASAGQIKVWKNTSNSANVTHDTKFRKNQVIGESFLGQKQQIRAMSVTLDGTRLLVGSNNDIHIFTVDKKSKKGNFKALRDEPLLYHRGPVNCLLSYGKYMLSASSDCNVLLWSMSTYEVLNSYNAGSPIFCMTQMGIEAESIPKDEVVLNDVLVCGTAAGTIVMLPLPLANNSASESSTWEAVITQGSTMGISSICIAWGFIFAGIADGSVRTFAVIYKTDFDSKRPIQMVALQQVATNSVHNGPVTGVTCTGGHLFSASHDYSILPWLPPEKLKAKTEAQFEQSIDKGFIVHRAPIIAMASNQMILVTGDENGNVAVIGPKLMTENLGGSQEPKPVLPMVFSFLDHDFKNCFSAHQDCVMEEEVYLSIVNHSERVSNVRCLLKRNPNFRVEFNGKSDRIVKLSVTGSNVTKEAVELMPNEKVIFRIVFTPTEEKNYKCAIDFLVDQLDVVTVHVRGAGLVPRLLIENQTPLFDFGTVTVGKAPGIQTISFTNIGLKDLFVNILEQEFTTKEDGETKTWSFTDRGVTIWPRCFPVPAMGTKTILVNFTPRQKIDTFEIPLKFNICGGVYTMTKLRFRSVESRDAVADSEPIAPSSEGGSLSSRSIVKNIGSTIGKPKGLRVLQPTENLAQLEVHRTLLHSIGWRFASDEVLTVLYHLNSGAFIEMPQKITEEEELNHVDLLKIKYRCVSETYYELWHGDHIIDCGVGEADKPTAVEFDKDRIKITSSDAAFLRMQKKVDEEFDEDVLLLNASGHISLELFVFSRGTSFRDTSTKAVGPTKSPKEAEIFGSLQSVTHIAVNKGFRLTTGEGGIGYDFLDRMDVAGIEKVITYDQTGAAILYEVFGTVPRGGGSIKDIGSPIFSPAIVSVNGNAFDGANPTHYEVTDITAVRVLNKENEANEHKAVRSNVSIKSASGVELVDLGRPRMGMIKQQEGVKRLINVKLLKSTNEGGQTRIKAVGASEGVTLEAHTTMHMFSRARACKVPGHMLYPYEVRSGSHSVTVGVVPPKGAQEQEELRIVKLSSMIDELRGGGAWQFSAKSNIASQKIPVSFHGKDNEFRWHFIIDGATLKLVSADPLHNRYLDANKSTDIIFSVHGFQALMENDETLYCDDGFEVNITSKEDVPVSKRPTFRFDNNQGRSIEPRNAPEFMTEVWEQYCRDELIEAAKKGMMRLVVKYQQELLKNAEREASEMLKAQKEKERLILLKKGGPSPSLSASDFHARKEVEKAAHELVESVPQKRTFKEVYEEMIRLTVEMEVTKEQREKEAAAAASGIKKPPVKVEKTAARLNKSKLLTYLQTFALPGADDPMSVQRSEMICRALEAEHGHAAHGHGGGGGGSKNTGTCSLEQFKLWFALNESKALMAELNEKTVFARLLEEQMRIEENFTGLKEEDHKVDVHSKDLQGFDLSKHDNIEEDEEIAANVGGPSTKSSRSRFSMVSSWSMNKSRKAEKDTLYEDVDGEAGPDSESMYQSTKEPMPPPKKMFGFSNPFRRSKVKELLTEEELARFNKDEELRGLGGGGDSGEELKEEGEFDEPYDEIPNADAEDNQDGGAAPEDVDVAIDSDGEGQYEEEAEGEEGDYEEEDEEAEEVSGADMDQEADEQLDAIDEGDEEADEEEEEPQEDEEFYEEGEEGDYAEEEEGGVEDGQYQEEDEEEEVLDSADEEETLEPSLISSDR